MSTEPKSETVSRETASQIEQLRKTIKSLSRQPRILIVEDSRNDADLLENSIRGIVRAEIVFASTAEEAQGLMAEKKFDVVFLDLKLPKMPGIELVRNLSELDRKRLVIITGLEAEYTDTVESIRLGAVKVIYKPPTESDLKSIFGHEL